VVGSVKLPSISRCALRGVVVVDHLASVSTTHLTKVRTRTALMRPDLGILAISIRLVPIQMFPSAAGKTNRSASLATPQNGVGSLAAAEHNVQPSEAGGESSLAKCTTEKLCPVHNRWHPPASRPAAEPNRSADSP